MKKVLIALMSVAVLGGMSSCSDWLEVDADTRVGENVMFETGSGMRIALNGVYSSLADKQLYAQELTWALASTLSRDYLETQLPTNYRYLIYEGEWYESYSRKVIDPVWNKAYNALANVNNLLQAVEKQEESFFQGGKLERNMFIAELRGIRALLHFDMLRLFAPAPIKDDGKAYIPYVEKYPEYQPKKLTVSETMDKIEADLIAASDLLADIDTASADTEYDLSGYGMYTSSYRLNHSTSSYSSSEPKGEWFALRGFRMNYYAVRILMMRLYMWKGDYTAVIETSKSIQYKKWFNLASARGSYTNFTNSSSFQKLYHDIMFAGYNPELDEVFTTLSTTNKKFRYDQNYFKALYTNDADDYRGKLMSTTTNDNRSLRWLAPETETTNSKIETPMIPIIRLSEVYLMLAEAYAGSDLTKAVDILQKFRQQRNAKRVLSINTKTEFMKELELEWAREYQSEGQRFYCYKRLNLPIYQGEGKAAYDYDAIDCWVLQQPEQEDSYRL